MTEAVDFAVADFFEVVDLGLARGQALLTAGELLVVRRMRSLEGPAAALYARLSARRGTVFAVDRLELADGGVPEAVDTLVEAGLLTRFVPWPGRLEVLTVEELKAVCRRHRLRVGGKREALVERVRGLRAGRDRDVVRLCHPELILRLERFALGRIHPDRSRWVLDRMGMVRWADYTPTRGAAVFPTRAALRDWEALLGAAHTPEEALAIVGDPARVWPPGALDPRRRLARGVMEAARDLERNGELGRAEALYRGLAELRGRGPVAVRLARVVELQARPTEALDLLAEARDVARRPDRVGIDRAARRLARDLRRSWAPSRPLAAARERQVRIAQHGGGARPLWGEGEVIEEAVRTLLAGVGRRALLAEGPLWRTLFALLFAEAYFLPVPGQLPAPFLAGPLDLGTPGFRSRRAAAIDAVLAEVRGGGAGDRLDRAAARWWGVRLAGAKWDRFEAADLVTLGRGMSGAALAALLEVLLDRGFGAAAGLPDLVVLPGEGARLPDALPSRLPEGVLLVEVKGPTDSLRDEQRVWHDHLHRAGAAVELWKVRS